MVLTYKNKFNKKYGFDKDEPHSLKEISDITGFKLSGLQTIFNRGIGAFRNNPSSIRPNVKSEDRWAYARVYAALDPSIKSNKIYKMFLIKKKSKKK